MMNKEDPHTFESRKVDHIRYSMSSDAQVDVRPSDLVRLPHHPLPNLNFKEIEIETGYSKYFPSHKPLLVSSMTGGHEKSLEINRILLSKARENSWIFSTGSLRRELEDPEYISEWSVLQDEGFFESYPVIGNIGIAQVIESPLDEIERLVNQVGLSGLFVHLNPLQEVIQAEGTTDFRGGFEALKNLNDKLSVPLFVKETGTGFSKPSLEKLNELKLSVIDVAGLGGTHWGRVEGLRAKSDQNFLSDVAETYAYWGHSTVSSLISMSEAVNESEPWASGGLRSGLDAAICFALGAKTCGFAMPFMKAALEDSNMVQKLIDQIEYELKIALFNTDCKNIESLSTLRGIEWV